jgi:diguanylate cyclase (GGDEF)-like protein
VLPAEPSSSTDPVRALQRRLARERAARLEAEAIAERVTSELYETVQQLTKSTKVAELLGSVAMQANEAASARDAVAAALASVCDYTGWPVGHAFVRSADDPDLLVSMGVLRTPADSGFEAFLRDTSGCSFRSGEGLPGRTLRDGRSSWIIDLAADANFPRRESALGCGLRAAFAAPVLIRSDTVAVLEFFAPGIQPPDDNLLQVVSFVGAQLGRVLERELAEERLTRQALYDDLTGLPNRALLMDRLHGSLARARRSHRTVHVLYLDIDDFKTINDSRGHTEGDAVLAALAHRLQDTLRSSDSVGRASHDIVARLGGDEFAIVLEDCLVPGAVAGRIQTLLHTPLQVDDHEVFISVSIGSMVIDGSAADPAPEAVLAAANVAMHEAKRAGKSRHLVFEPRMQDEAQRRHALGEELRSALERSEFTLAYQPVVDLETGAVIGAEALVRWQHPVRGTVAPDEFISRAEETGLIVGMGTWVLEEACRQAVSWRRGGAVDFTIAVNVSGRQLREPDFVTVVRAVLSRTGLHPTALCLEMTESILMERDDAAIAMLTELRGDGVHLAIDDFGTGYSSLGALRRLPVDLLKIDRSFISSLPEDDDAGTIAWAVVRLGHTLDLPVLAEGIETEEQRAALRRFGCDQAQGYLFGRPMPAEQFAAVALPST